MSDTFFWATVKSDLPIFRMAAAELSRPLLTTVRTTTVMTANATAKASPKDRAFFAQMLLRSRTIVDTVEITVLQVPHDR